MAADPQGAAGDVSKERLGLLFRRTADALRRWAELAEEHAAACDRAGQPDLAEKERRAAGRARAASENACARARELFSRHGNG